MARKHTKSISFYLSEEDYESIKHAASQRRMTMKEYLIQAHKAQIGKPGSSIEEKLDLILEEIRKTSTHDYKIKHIVDDSQQWGTEQSDKFQIFLDELRTERQRKNSSIIYQMIQEAGDRGISLMMARNKTSSTAKKTLDAMVEAGIIAVRGKRYYII